jgi:hypothetical protein
MRTIMPRQRAKKWSKNRYSYSAYLLYWYKSANADVALAPQLEAGVTSLEQDEARELMSHLTASASSSSREDQLRGIGRGVASSN